MRENLKILVILFLAVSLFSLPLSSQEKAKEKWKLRFPGSIWAEFRYPNSPQPEDKDNWMVGGRIEQGIDWFTLGNGLTLNTFAELEYGHDKVGFDWNNKVAPGAGIKLKIPITYNGLIQLGFKYVSEYRWKSDRQNSVFMVFANWWFGWNL